MTATAQFEKRIRRAAAYLVRVAHRTNLTLRFRSNRLFPGSFASPFSTNRGLTPDPSRTFRPDDNASQIDFRRCASALLKGLPIAIANGDLRVRQAVFESEAEFTLVADLSRSMLGQFFDHSEADHDLLDAYAKIGPLFAAASAFLSIAASANFTLRTVLMNGEPGRLEVHRARSPDKFPALCLELMSMHLLETFRRAEQRPDAREPFSLAAALHRVLATRRRGVAVVVSDFLDPFDSYASELHHLFALRRVVLVDVASPGDRAFPLPTWWTYNATRIEVREGARHLEEGTQECPIDAAMVRSWNRRAQHDLVRLRELARRWGAPLLTAKDLGASFAHIHATSVHVLKSIP